MFTERVQYAIDNFIMDDYFLEMQKNYHLKEEKDSGKSDLDVTIKNDKLAFGRSIHEAPDIDGNIFIEGAEDVQIGDIVRVRILQGFTYEMVGELIK